ncbi:hypothetical protein JF50_21040 [Pseudoalteromonas luteoviolacea]|uniref:Efflux RND transporter permease subunit n=2 Tax=Pseudoalteromonas luteoviolacea TaxID=43657 RepID=A0A0C1Q419_9GAMM|nr:hypothetical protein JF50_21040 [Pseudoalteromonas luteoviolacea]
MSGLLARYKFIFAVTVFLTICGSYVANKLPISMYPTVNKPNVRVTLRPMQDAYGFYNQWGHKIERSLKTISNVVDVEGTYKQGLVRYSVNFDWQVDPEIAKRDVAAIASFYHAQLPEHEPAPIVDILDPSSENYFIIYSDKFNNAELSRLLDEQLVPMINDMEGVAFSRVSKGNLPFVNIRLSPYKLIEYGISASDVIDTLNRHQYDLKLGELHSKTQGKISLKLNKSLSNLDEIKRIKVATIAGSPVLIEHVASVFFDKEPNRRHFLLDNKDVVTLAMWPKPNANIYQVSKEFKRVVNEFVEGFGGVAALNDPQRFIDKAIESILYALLLGMAISVFVVLVFYRKLSSTLIICISMPISLALGILIMRASGVSINLLSLGGMSISIGLVVDNVIIVLDRIERARKQSGLLSFSVIVEAVRDVTSPIMVSTITSVLVFLPLAFSHPAVSSILRDIVLVSSSIIISSLFISIFLTPSIYMLFCKNRPARKMNTKEKESTAPKYIVFLHRHVWLSAVVCLSVISVSIYLIADAKGKLKTEIIAEPKAEIIDVAIDFNEVGVSKIRKLEIIKPIYDKIKSELDSEVNYVYMDMRDNIVFLSLFLNSYKQFETSMDKLSKIDFSNEYSDVSYSPFVTAALNVKSNPDLIVKVLGKYPEQNRLILKEVYKISKSDKGLIKKVKNIPGDRKSKSLVVNYNELAINNLLESGLSDDKFKEIENYIEYSSEPRKLYNLKLQDQELPLKLSVDKNKDQISHIYEVPLVINDHAVYLNDLITLTNQQEWRQYYSRNGELSYQVNIWFNPSVNKKQIEAFKDRLKAVLREHYPDGVLPIAFEKGSEDSTLAVISLVESLILSFALVFMVIMAVFHSYSRTLICCLSILFSISGAMVALVYFDCSLSVNALLGVLILVGLSVNNSILILDQYIKFKSVLDLSSAIYMSVKVRLKSLAVTNLTTVGGMVPLIIGFGPGEDILRPLGVSVAFGLISTTIFTIFTMPFLLTFIDRKEPFVREEVAF